MIKLRVPEGCEKGVSTSVVSWLSHFGLKPSEEPPTKILIILPEDVPPRIEITNALKPGIDYLIVTSKSSYKLLREFLSSGVISVDGPLEQEWPDHEAFTWLILSSAVEIKASERYGKMRQYYSENWPAILSPLEFVIEELGVDRIDRTDLSLLGIAPSKLLEIDRCFNDVVGSWNVEEWLKFFDMASSR